MYRLHYTTHTFCCESRNASSLIDNFLVSITTCMLNKVDMCYTIDSGLNFSDHLPLVLGCQLPADLMSYYFTTDHYLSSVDMTAITQMNYCFVGYKYLLVATDYFTKWLEAIPLCDAEAHTCMRALYSACFSRFGLPRQLHSDQGGNFESRAMLDRWYK